MIPDPVKHVPDVLVLVQVALNAEKLSAGAGSLGEVRHLDLEVLESVDPPRTADDLHAVVDAQLSSDGDADAGAGARHERNPSSESVHLQRGGFNQERAFAL